LAVAKKADSQEICFIGKEGYKGFLEARTANTARPQGKIVTLDGTPVGTHEGLHRYTIGQRKGLMVDGKDYENFFVVGFDTERSSVIIGPESALFSPGLVASQINWIQPSPGLGFGLECRARIRSRHEEAECFVTQFSETQVHVEFKDKQRAITPGQAIVFYQGDEVIGGGFIDHKI
jgi:tRNA-specific 2-thiouridylase